MITDCYADCNITTIYDYAGGITAGGAGQISNCYVISEIAAMNLAGGIIGRLRDATVVEDSY